MDEKLVEYAVWNNYLQSVLQLLKYGRGERLPGKYAEILRLMAGSLTDREVKFWREAFGVYVMAADRDMNQDDVDRIVRDVFPTQIELGSIADRLIRRGYQKGLQQGYMPQFELGRAAGKIQVLQEWLGDQVSSDRELLGPDLEELQQTINALEERRRQSTSPE